MKDGFVEHGKIKSIRKVEQLDMLFDQAVKADELREIESELKIKTDISKI
jgi:hypothetical protein